MTAYALIVTTLLIFAVFAWSICASEADRRGRIMLNLLEENLRLKADLRKNDRVCVELARRVVDPRGTAAADADPTPLHDRMVCERLEREFGGGS